jgi:DNA-binding CsgD family transcriptional regulator
VDAAVPLQAFEPFAVWLTGADGTIRYCNARASALFGCVARGRPCWETIRILDAHGEALCGARCRIRRAAGAGALRPRHRVLYLSSLHERLELDLLTLVVPLRGRRGGPSVLHLLLTDQPRPQATAGLAHAANRLRDLSRRETQVLDLLAAGCGTAAIAVRLFISRATVRNHVQHVLGKLGVHGRLEAILTLLHDREIGARPPTK